MRSKTGWLWDLLVEERGLDEHGVLRKTRQEVYEEAGDKAVATAKRRGRKKHYMGSASGIGVRLDD
jgi:hypothetical protein